MNKPHETAPTQKPSQGLLWELGGAILSQMPRDLTEDEIKALIAKKRGGRLRRIVTELVRPKPPKALVREWQELYHFHFQIDVDLTGVIVPVSHFTRPILVAEGLTLSQVYEALPFPKWKWYEDLDKQITQNDRSPDNRAYAIVVRDLVETDPYFRNRTPNELEKCDFPGITLLERMLLELKYFSETGQHLDMKSMTLCTGSRDDCGGVPGCGWGDGEFGVYNCLPGNAYPNIGSREVVSAIS